jgi:MFS family permease
MNLAESLAVSPALARRIAWRLLPPISVAYLLNYLDRFNLSFAALQLEGSLGLNAIGFGFAGSCFSIGYLLFQVPADVLLMRLGARRWLAIVAMGWGAVACLTALVRTPAEFYLARFLLGAVEAGFVPAIVLYLSWWFPTRLRTQVVAAYGQSVPLAGIIGGPLAGWILSTFAGLGSSEGWRILMILEGAPSLPVGLWLYFSLPDQPADASWLTAPEADQVNRSSTLSHGRPAPVTIAEILATLRFPAVWRLCLTYFLMVAGTFGITLWLPQFLRLPGWESPAVIGWISVIPWLFGSLSILAVSRLADRRRSYAGVAAIGALCSGGALVAAGMMDNRWAALGLMTLAVGAMLASTTSFWGLPPEILAGEHAAVGVPTVNAAGFAGALVSPVVIGWIASTPAKMAGGITFCGVLLAACALALWSWRSYFQVSSDAPEPIKN